MVGEAIINATASVGGISKNISQWFTFKSPLQQTHHHWKSNATDGDLTFSLSIVCRVKFTLDES